MALALPSSVFARRTRAAAGRAIVRCGNGRLPVLRTRNRACTSTRVLVAAASTRSARLSFSTRTPGPSATAHPLAATAAITSVISRRRIAPILARQAKGLAVKTGERSDVVDALGVEHTRHAPNIGEDALELSPFGQIEHDLDPRTHLRAGAFERSNVGAGIADRSGNSRQNPRPVFSERPQPDLIDSGGQLGPLDFDPPIRLVEQIFHIRAFGTVHGHAAPAGHIADNAIARNRSAAVRTVDQHIVEPADPD